MAGDDDLRVTSSLIVPARELRWTFGPSGGPGGQHANRAHTRVEVRFDIAGSAALRDSQRALLLSRLGSVVVASADDERSQIRNRRLALERLRRKLADAMRVDRARRPSRPSRGAVERRLESKRRQSARKRDRRIDGDGHER